MLQKDSTVLCNEIPRERFRSFRKTSPFCSPQLRVLQVTSEALKFPTESIGHPGSGATGGGRVDECGEEGEGRRMSCPVFFIDINHHHHTYQTSTQNFQLKFIIKWREGQELTRDGAWLIILTGDRWGDQSLIVRIVIRSPRLSLILLSPHQSRPRPGLRLCDDHTTHNSPILTLSQRISDSQL